MSLAQVKILSLEWDSTRQHPKFHLRPRLSDIPSQLSEKGLESISFFTLYSLERDMQMQKNLHKYVILLLLPCWIKCHSTHNFNNLHIKLTILTHISFLSQSLSMIKQPILIKHRILSNSTNYSNPIQLICITSQTLSILNHKHFQ